MILFDNESFILMLNVIKRMNNLLICEISYSSVQVNQISVYGKHIINSRNIDIGTKINNDIKNTPAYILNLVSKSF